MARLEVEVLNETSPLDSVDVGQAFAVYRRFVVRVAEDDRYPYDLELEVDAGPAGLQCVRLECTQKPGGPAVSGEGIRSVPVASILREAAPMAGLTRFGPYLRADGVAPEDRADFAAELTRAARRRRGGDSTPETLRRVAELYRAAVASGEPPSLVIKRELNYSQSHARRLVGQARDAKLLGPPIPGLAGEKEDPDGAR